MRWRTTAILLLITIGLGAYVSLYELRRPTREEHDALTKQVLSVAPETVTRLTLQTSKGRVEVEHSDRGWRLAPQALRADESRIASLLDQLSPLSAQRVLAGTPQKPLDYAAFGLAPEQGSLTVLAGGRSTSLLFGDATPVGQSRYAKRVDRPEVYVIPASVYDELDVPVGEFRDPSLISIKGWTVHALAIQGTAMPFALARRGDAWQLTAPREDRADRGEVTTLVNRVGGLRIARFVDDTPQVERLADWGFDHPKAELRVALEDLPATVTVFFGAPLPDAAGMLYAKRSDEPALYAVAGSDVEALLVDPHTLRSKACFEFFTSQVTKADLRNGQTHWTAVKQEGQWKADPGGTPLDAGRVEDFLSTAADLRLGGFVDDAAVDLPRYGLNPPQGAVTVWTAGAEAPQRLLIGAAAPKASGRYGQIEGRSAIVRLPEAVGKLLDTTLDALRPADGGAGAPAPSATVPHASR